MNLDTIWQDFLNIIRQEAGSRIVETWFKAVVFCQWDSHSKTVYLKVPNTFVKDWIISNYQPLFKLHLGRLLNEQKLNLIFLDDLKTGSTVKVNNSTELMPAYCEKTNNEKKKLNLLKPLNSFKNAINDNYKFDNFVVGPNNSLAYAAANAVTEKPGILYNPLFIYGSSGLGKTHLLHAIGNQIKLNQSKPRILYQTADRFVSEFINAIRFNKVPLFENKYKDLDVLLIDDIQFISNKEQTQESFFHIFNMLYESQKQIIITSDSMPKDIVGLAQRLRTRLDGGLIADVQIPTIETKIAILKKKADYHKEILSDEVAYFIASRVLSSIRELEGFLIRVLAFANLTQEPLSLELAQRVLGNSTKENNLNILVNFDRIATCISQHYNFSLEELRSSKRNKNITLARNAAMYLMKKITNKPLSEIASFWLRKDHSTVVHALNKFEEVKKTNPQIHNEIENLHKIIISQ